MWLEWNPNCPFVGIELLAQNLSDCFGRQPGQVVVAFVSAFPAEAVFDPMRGGAGGEGGRESVEFDRLCYRSNTG